MNIKAFPFSSVHAKHKILLFQYHETRIKQRYFTLYKFCCKSKTEFRVRCSSPSSLAEAKSQRRIYIEETVQGQVVYVAGRRARRHL